MCGLRIKTGLFMLLLLFCLWAPGICSAETYTMTAEQLASSDQKLDMLQQIIDSSKILTTDSAKLINSLQSSLGRAVDLSAQSGKIIEEQKQTIQKQAQSLENSKALIAKLEKQARRNSISFYGSTESMGLMVKVDKVILFGGPKYSSGYEVGASVTLITF